MRKLFAILMSFHLMVLPLSGLAQTTGGTSGGGDNYNIPGTSEVPAAATPGDAYDETGNGSSEGSSQFSKSLMMTGSGIVGANLIYCKGSVSNLIPTFSHYLFMAGAVALLGGELLEAFSQSVKKAENEVQLAKSKVTSTAVIDGLTKEQKDANVLAMEKALGELENLKDALDRRITWLLAAEAIYWTAVAGAATETILYALTKVPAYGSAIGYYDWGLSCQANEKYQKITLKLVAVAYGAAPDLINGEFSSAGTKALSTVSFIGGLNWAMGKVGDKFYRLLNSAPARAFLFGAFATLADITREGFKARRKQANADIEKYRDAIKTWRKASTVTNEIAAGSTTDPNSKGPKISVPSGFKNGKLNLLQAGKTGKCLSAGATGLEHSEKACSTPIKFNRSMIKFDSQLLKGVSDQSFNLAEALARDDSATASVLAENLGSNAARIKTEALDLIKKANDEMKKNGEKPLDFDKEVKAQLGSFSQGARDSSSNGNKLGSTSSSTPSEKKSENSTDEAPVAKAVSVGAPVPEATPALDMSSLSSEPVSDAVDPSLTKTASAPQSLDDYESSAEDISKTKEVSLFKQVSNRYILNYTKMFERKKEISAPTAPSKNAQ